MFEIKILTCKYLKMLHKVDNTIYIFLSLKGVIKAKQKVKKVATISETFWRKTWHDHLFGSYQGEIAAKLDNDQGFYSPY